MCNPSTQFMYEQWRLQTQISEGLNNEWDKLSPSWIHPWLPQNQPQRWQLYGMIYSQTKGLPLPLWHHLASSRTNLGAPSRRGSSKSSLNDVINCCMPWVSPQALLATETMNSLLIHLSTTEMTTTHRGRPKRRAMAILTALSSSLRPREVIGRAWSQAPASGAEAAWSLAHERLSWTLAWREAEVVDHHMMSIPSLLSESITLWWRLRLKRPTSESLNNIMRDWNWLKMRMKDTALKRQLQRIKIMKVQAAQHFKVIIC